MRTNRVDRNIIGLGSISLPVDVNVADTIQVFDHWNGRFTGKPLNEAVAASRHNDVDVLIHRNQFAYQSAVGVFDDLYRCLGQTCNLQAVCDTGGQRQI